MNKDDFVKKYYIERKHTTSIKWDLLKKYFGAPDLTPMWVADMDFKTCDSVTDALIRRVTHGAYGYTYIARSYYDAFLNWMESRHGYAIQKEWLRISTGVVTTLYRLVNCFTRPKDAVIIITPVYYPFHNLVNDCGRKLITCDMLNNAGYFTVDYDAFEQKIIDNNVKLYIMSSPHNPVGRVWTEAELDQMMFICKKHDVLVISDEIHQDFVFGESRHIPAPLVGGGNYSENLIIVNSASKTFNLAALLHANIIIRNPDIRAEYDAFAKQNFHADFNIMGLIATEAAYAGGTDWLEGLKQLIESNYHYMEAGFRKHLPDITISPLEGTYLPLVDMRTLIKPENIKTFIQDRCRLAVDYGEWFGSGYTGFIRLNIATHPDIVRTMVATVINEYGKESG